jgi:hypothetical protein
VRIFGYPPLGLGVEGRTYRAPAQPVVYNSEQLHYILCLVKIGAV